MNIVIGKFGKSILFDDTHWTSPIGGDNEPSNYYKALFKYNPDWNFYIIGKSDYSRLNSSLKKKINVNNNVFDIWENKKPTLINDPHLIPIEELKNIKIDCGIFFSGPAGNANIPGKVKVIQKGKEGQIAKVLEMFSNYCGPIIHYLNETQIPYFTITPDPRYHPVRARDLFNLSKFSLSQYNSKNEYKVKHIKSYENQEWEIDSIPLYYSRIETTFLYERKQYNMFVEKSKLFTIIMNEGGNGGLLRGEFLEKFILNSNSEYLKNVEIYGKWDEQWAKKYKQFKGTILFNDLDKYLLNTKYTFIVPILKGWVTAKFWEMIYFGVIPFLHPYYDEQNHLKCPEFLRVSNQKELEEKIEELEHNKGLYITLFKELQDMLKNTYFSGKHNVNITRMAINKLINTKFELITDEEIDIINNKFNLQTQSPWSKLLNEK